MAARRFCHLLRVCVRWKRGMHGVAKNTGKAYRIGTVKARSQTKTSSGHSALRSTKTGRFLNVKSDGKPFKGVRKER